MTDFKTVKLANGVHGIIGKTSSGELKLQSLLFPRDKFSINDATIQAYHMQSVLI